MNKQLLKLRGKTAVFIDWANVYGWKKSLKKEIDLKKLYKYLKSYSGINQICFYFGKDNNKNSIEFLKNAEKIGYEVVTKPVKYVYVTTVEKEKIYRRKCDFDLEIGLDAMEGLIKFDSFIFFSGDGDFATLYERLIQKRKQVIVIYSPGHLGKEIWEMKRGIFKIEIKKLGCL